MSFSSRLRGGQLVAAIALCWISSARAGAEQKKPPVFGTDLALVQVSIKKALRHQIRAHFEALGHPLAGDELYGGPPRPGLTRHALHAYRVAFAGPSPDLSFDVEEPLPADLAALVPG